MRKEPVFSRRSFLNSAAGAACGFARADGAADTGIYISLNSTLTGGNVAWPEFAALAAKTGYGGVDVNLAAAMKEGVVATRTLLSSLKLRPSYCSLPVTAIRDEETFRKGMEGLDEAARFASAIGCPRMTYVMPASTDTPTAEMRKTLKARFTSIAQILARHTVRLGLEFRGSLALRTASRYEFIWRMSEMLQFASECGPNMGLLLDSWHWHHAGASVDEIVKAGKSRIVTVHVSDAPRVAPEHVRDNQRLFAGEGVINLAGYFKALKEIGYEDAVSPEPFGRVPKEMSPEEGARRGLESTLAVMRKAGLQPA